jgi:superfamily II DNA helicase RecQ
VVSRHAESGPRLDHAHDQPQHVGRLRSAINQIGQEDRLAARRRANLRGSFNRPNLYYEVRPKANAYKDLLSYLRQRKDASGIIYCRSRARTETLAEKLRRDGLSAVAYHAGLEGPERQRGQAAFGMGSTNRTSVS